MENIVSAQIPGYVLEIARKVVDRGYKIYLVGGSVRDLLLKRQALDYDLTTDATPDVLLHIFPEAKKVGVSFGTILIPVRLSTSDRPKEVEITTLRREEKYLDARHPSRVEFVKDIHLDLKRRDFTINALAIPFLPRLFAKHKKYNINRKYVFKLPVIDDFGGMQDIAAKLIRAVGNPEDRFKEDALRMLRACRFVAQLQFRLEEKTSNAISKMSANIRRVAIERVRDEFLKMLEKSPKPSLGLECLRVHGLLKYIIPELVETVGVAQPLGHVHDVYRHTLRVVDMALPHIRMAALLHDIAKPYTARGDGHFYGHDVKGAAIAEKILKRLKFPKKEIKRITTLVREHMFFYQPGVWTDSAVRRFIRRVGLEYIEDLFALRLADSKGNPKSEWEPAEITKFREHIQRILDQEHALKITDLTINGNDLINKFKLKPGPLIGEILEFLLEQVLDNPKLNNRKNLLKLARDFLKEYRSRRGKNISI